MAFDTNGDGILDSGRSSYESYRHAHDSYVNLAGRSWSFEVAPDGSRLALTALGENRPDRPSLADGKPAPDFEYADFGGAAGRLSDHRGRLVLLYFWNTHCGPCIRETPSLLAAWSRFHELGLDILGIAKEDQPTAVLSYVEQHGIAWPQILEDAEGPIVDLYRVDATPTAILVERDGAIASRSVGLAAIVDQIQERVRAESVSFPD